MEKVLAKLKESLSEEEIAEFQKAFEDIIAKRVDAIVEEKEKILEAAAFKMIKEEVDMAKEKMSEELKDEKEKELEELSSTLTEAMNQCINTALSEALNDEILEKVALAEMYAPIIQGTQELFESNLVKMSPQANKKVEILETEISDLKKKLDESYALNFENQKDKDILKKAILIESAKVNLTTPQAKQLELICEGVDFETLEKNMEQYVNHIMEASRVDPKSYLSEGDLKKWSKKRFAGEGSLQGPQRGDLDESAQSMDSKTKRTVVYKK